jgi:FlaG/FlaF family flagellin (archaellin)
MKHATQRNRSEEAVSPVVGVMLMLVVTIIIAAVVSSFASGVITATEKAPSAVLDVKIYSAANVGGTMSKTYAPDFTIDHLSGDALNTADLKLVFTWKNATGHIFRSIYDGPGMTNFSEDFSYYSYHNSSLYMNGNPSFAWGVAALTTGSHVQTGANYLKQDFRADSSWGSGTVTTHKGSVFMDDLMGRDIQDDYTPLAAGTGSSAATAEKGVMELLPTSTAVQVTIIHKPTGAAIYEKEVIVQ